MTPPDEAAPRPSQLRYSWVELVVVLALTINWWAPFFY